MKLTKMTTILFLIIFFLCGLTAFASEKDYSIEINKFYSSAKFTITLPDDNEYQITAYSPSGKSYDAVVADTNIMECIIPEELETGKWTVHVIKKFAEGDEETPVLDVSIVFEGLSEKTVDIGDNVIVATDIAGLIMYFKDDSFVAEWTDTTCGNVNIEVVNEKNNQVIDKKTVKEQYYELALTDDIESIIVKIVPSVSSNKDGAEKQFTYQRDNYPNATVNYEDISITNRDSINLNVNLEEPYSILVLNNGNELFHTDMLEAGDYNYEISTEVGENDYLTYIIDEKHNMRSFPGHVEKDVVAPVLQLAQEYTQIETTSENIVFEGKVEDYDKFTINDVLVEVEGDHTFKYDYSLKEGLNKIEIVASDEAGNISSYTATVFRIIPEEKGIPWDKIIIGVIILLLAILYVVLTIRKKTGNFPQRKRIKPENKTKKTDGSVKKTNITYDILGFVVPILTIFILFNFVIGITVIQSGSMEPTLMTGNTVFINRLAYKTGQEVKRGDIVIFDSEEFGLNFGKRVIGLPGDVIEFKDGYVVINGVYLDESAYIADEVETNCKKTFAVPDGCYFMLGDNRENSIDSRYWANPYIPKNDIIGRYMGQIDFSIQYDILGK